MTRFELPLALLLAFGLANPLRAQQAQPIVHATIAPARVIVGQPAIVRIEVLAPNYMTAPPELPDFQIANAMTRPLRSINTTEQRDGLTFAGVQFAFAIYPQEPGSYALGESKITVHYAADPPRSQAAIVSLPPLMFASYIPPAADALDPFVSATSLTLGQEVKRSSGDLKVGDSVARVVTTTAEGAPAMLLPPVVFPAAEGLAVYPAQPSFHESVDPRSETVAAIRVDSATYMLEKAGDYRLPPVEIRWWNVATGAIETARVDALAIHVAENPAAVRGPGAAPTLDRRRILDALIAHWPLWLGAIAMLGAIAWALPSAARRTTGWLRRRRHAWLESETRAFVRVVAMAIRRDARAFYRALLDWSAVLDPPATTAVIAEAAASTAFARELATIEALLFGAATTRIRPSFARLIVGLIRARHRLRKPLARSGGPFRLPASLNPQSSAPEHAQLRPVAR